MRFIISTPGYVTKRTENTVSNRYPHTRVHSSTIHDNEKVEATQPFTADE